MSYSETVGDKHWILVSILQIVSNLCGRLNISQNQEDHLNLRNLSENEDEVMYLLKRGQELWTASENEFAINIIEGFAFKHIDIFKKLPATKKNQKFAIEYFMNYLNYLTFVPESDEICLRLINRLNNYLQEYEVEGEMLIKALIIKGRYYFEHKDPEQSEKEFFHALKAAKHCGYVDIDIWNNQFEPDEEVKVNPQVVNKLAESLTSSVSTRNSIWNPTLSGVDVPEIMFDIPFYLILLEKDKTDKEQTLNDVQYLLNIMQK